MNPRNFMGGAGKGDADRSPGWRKNYHEINWHRPGGAVLRVFRKVYGPVKPKVNEDYREIEPMTWPDLVNQVEQHKLLRMKL